MSAMCLPLSALGTLLSRSLCRLWPCVPTLCPPCVCLCPLLVRLCPGLCIGFGRVCPLLCPPCVCLCPLLVRVCPLSVRHWHHCEHVDVNIPVDTYISEASLTYSGQPTMLMFVWHARGTFSLAVIFASAMTAYVQATLCRQRTVWGLCWCTSIP